MTSTLRWALPVLALLPACGDVWKPAFDTSETGALSGVWGSGPDDVWIVGGSEAGGEAYHDDGSGFAEVSLPEGTPLLVWVYGFASDDVYTVGLDGSMLHWDGSAWAAMDTGVDVPLWGIWGASPTDLWIVGGDGMGEEPFVMHYDGADFEPYTLPEEENSRHAGALYKVWGIGDTLFSVGQRGLIVQWDGTAWNEVSGGANADQDFVSLWGTAEDHVVAVGGRSNARIATWDGTSWTTITPSRTAGLNAVFMPDPDQAIIGGVRGTAGRFDPSTAEFVADESVTELDIHAIWCDGERDCIGVGGQFREPYSGTALVRRFDR